jgi:hypothetical protein
MKNFLTVVFLFVINFSHSQSIIKYIDFDSAITDLRKNGTKSSYYNIVVPEYLLYLNCKFFDEMVALYGKDRFSIGKKQYCYSDEKQRRSFDFSANSFREIFDNESKTNELLKKISNLDYNNVTSIDSPIYLLKNQALVTINLDNGSETYRMKLSHNQIEYEICTSIIE